MLGSSRSFQRTLHLFVAYSREQAGLVSQCGLPDCGPQCQAPPVIGWHTCCPCWVIDKHRVAFFIAAPCLFHLHLLLHLVHTLFDSLPLPPLLSSMAALEPPEADLPIYRSPKPVPFELAQHAAIFFEERLCPFPPHRYFFFVHI